MSGIIKRLFFSITLLVIADFITAQQYNFKNYTVKNGLPSSVVNNIFQDSKGYIWFGTEGGASRFNGAGFKNFNKEDGLISNDVTFVTEDKKGNIWIGTTEGVSKFDGIEFANYNEKNGFTKGAVYGIYVDVNNRIFFATREGGIRIFDGNKFDSLTTKNGLASNSIYTIQQDRNHNLWFGLENGIAKFDGKVITSYDSILNIHGKNFFSSLLDINGNVWFGSTTGEVIIFDGKNFNNFNLPAALKNDFIGSIAQDKKGNVWFATNHGAIKFGNGEFKNFTRIEGLSENIILCLASDYEGNVWIGSQGGGVNLFCNESFVTYTEKNGLSNNNISCVYNDPIDNLYYVGLPGGGLNILFPDNGSKFETISGIKKLVQANVSFVTTDKKHNIWVAAEEGVFVLRKTGNAFQLKKEYHRIDNHDLISPQRIIHDKKGNCWIATYGSGIFLVNGAVEKSLSTKNGFASDNILTAFEDSKSNIWIGTVDAGVIKYNGKVFQQFQPNGSFPDKAIWAITEDCKGNIYFGTREHGLCCFDGKNLKTYSIENGICSNSISALLWDTSANCLWLGSEKGINKIEFKKNLEIENINTYNDQDALGLSGVNPNSIFQDKNGHVWFGSVNGLCRYNSKYDVKINIPPKIYLTGIRLAYQKVNWNKYADTVDNKTDLPVNLSLSYQNNSISFDFQALTTENVRYTYILEGQDKEWSPLTKNTEANFPNITTGRQYTFKVKAVNSRGIWSKENVAFTFFSKPPWWKTWWFYSLSFIICITSIGIFIKSREQILKIQNLKLEKTVIERTAEVVTQKDIILNEKKRSDDLLLNILPVEVAEELKERGTAAAKYFDNVTVLFTDFVGFTRVSEQLSAQQLVDELHACFSAFDGIIHKYNIEKIKTVGDAYLAAAGLPHSDEKHAENVLNAAKEIREYMLTRKKELGVKTFEIRIGVHSGSVVAGIVGVKKFAYDIWGDTVNTAARMEQNSEAGKINISESTYELVKEQFTCEYRGEIEAKNKGKMKMYFVV